MIINSSVEASESSSLNMRLLELASEFLQYRTDAFLEWNWVFHFCRCRTTLKSLKKAKSVMQFMTDFNMKNMYIHMLGDAVVVFIWYVFCEKKVKKFCFI